jgi:hypothetical protein
MLALLAWGCDQDLSHGYELIVRVSSGPSRSLEGARVSSKGRELGVTDSTGAVTVQARGREGDMFPVDIACPPGHRAPPPLLVPLRQVGREGSGQVVRPEFAAVCTPLTQSIVVAVRAEGGPHLPLMHMGRELCRTDASGAAHVLLDVALEDVVELTLDTSGQPSLRPRNPILRVQPGLEDAITAISQELTVQPQPRVEKVTAPRRGPIRID